jgi:hypothetical protein
MRRFTELEKPIGVSFGGERGISDRRFYFLEFPDDFRVTQGYV